jgi:hypothetical protein
MNIIELVRQIASEYPNINQFTNEINIDFTEPNPTNFGLSSVGDQLIKEDILGNQLRQHNFVLYAINQAYTNYDRLANSNFLLEFSYWLERAAQGQEIVAAIDGYGTFYPGEEYPEEDRYPVHSGLKGELTKLSAANAMLYMAPTGDINDGVTYQIQIYARYYIESEEL